MLGLGNPLWDVDLFIFYLTDLCMIYLSVFFAELSFFIGQNLTDFDRTNLSADKSVQRISRIFKQNGRPSDRYESTFSVDRNIAIFKNKYDNSILLES